MRLLNVETLQLESFFSPENTPPYAVLSHAWEDEEVLFGDITESAQDVQLQKLEERLRVLESRVQNSSQPEPRYSHPQPSRTHLDRAKMKKGWPKILGCCREAAKFGLGHVWIDTCCIYKGDSSELSEAINSMFAWYRDAEVCFAYLSDASNVDEAVGVRISTGPPKSSRWFTRGWTLQELIAPTELIFYERNWFPLGSRSSLSVRIHITTEIPQGVLKKGISDNSFLELSIAAKMSWAAHRQTTRPEDRAYALMGLFSVNMPTLYGEGEKSAFFRLQTEIFQASSADHSIFAWSQDQFDIRNHPEGTRHTFGYYVSEWERAGVDLFAPSSAGFAPGPRFQDLPLNVTSRSDIGLVDFTSLPNYPTIERDPYDLKFLSWNVPDTGKYSASSHGMRVQMLLEHVQQIDPESGLPGANIFIAHLACKWKSTSDLVGIYLISDKPGQYRRIYPRSLVAIDPKYHAECQFVLEDIYVTRTDALLYPGNPPDSDPRVYGFKGVFTLNIVDEKLSRVGYKVSDTSPCRKEPNPKGAVLIFEDDSWRKDDQTTRHIILFEELEASGPLNWKSRIAVAWEIENGLFKIGVDTSIDFTKALQQYLDASSDQGNQYRAYDLRDALSLPLEVYKVTQNFKFHYSARSEEGDGVIVSFRQVGGTIFLSVSIYPHFLADAKGVNQNVLMLPERALWSHK